MVKNTGSNEAMWKNERGSYRDDMGKDWSKSMCKHIYILTLHYLDYLTKSRSNLVTYGVKKTGKTTKVLYPKANFYTYDNIIKVDGDYTKLKKVTKVKNGSDIKIKHIFTMGVYFTHVIDFIMKRSVHEAVTSWVKLNAMIDKDSTVVKYSRKSDTFIAGWISDVKSNVKSTDLNGNYSSLVYLIRNIERYTKELDGFNEYNKKSNKLSSKSPKLQVDFENELQEMIQTILDKYRPDRVDDVDDNVDDGDAESESESESEDEAAEDAESGESENEDGDEDGENGSDDDGSDDDGSDDDGSDDGGAKTVNVYAVQISKYLAPLLHDFLRVMALKISVRSLYKKEAALNETIFASILLDLSLGLNLDSNKDYPIALLEATKKYASAQMQPRKKPSLKLKESANTSASPKKKSGKAAKKNPKKKGKKKKKEAKTEEAEDASD